MKTLAWLDEVAQWVGIIVLTVAACSAFGGMLDWITTRVCPEYFQVHNPTAWIWTTALVLGLGIATAGRFGERPRFKWIFYTRPLIGVFLITSIIAAAAWGLGYVAAKHEELGVYHATALLIPAAKLPVFIAAESAHQMSWLSGVLGGVALCGWSWKKRVEIEATLGRDPQGPVN
jgi:hypothetical protein